MKAIFVIFIIVLAAVFIVGAVNTINSQESLTKRTFLNYFGSWCLIIGIVGFFSPSIFAILEIKTPKAFEWPIGGTNSALEHPEGVFIVPHEPSGRIQIYDKSLNYIQGWSVNASTGTFNLFPATDNTFYVYTARGDMKYEYDLSGKILSSEKFSDPYPHDRKHLARVSIPTPFYLWIFTHPFKAFFLLAIGIIISNINRKSDRHTQAMLD